MNLFEYELESENDKKPYNTHLLGEVSNSLWFMVDSTNQLILLKSIDKGANWDIVTTRTHKIQSGWHDRDNDIIYFVDCDNDNTADDFDVWKITTDGNDTITSVGTSTGADANTVYAFDIFMIGTDVFVINRESRATQIKLVIWDVDTSPFIEKDNVNSNDWTNMTYGVVVGTKYYTYADIFFVTPIFRAIYDNFTTHLSVSTTDLGNYHLTDSENQHGTSYDGTDIIYFVIKKTADSKNYLVSYSISGNSYTILNEYNICLMLDRNNSGINPHTNEKAFELAGTKIYKLFRNRTGLIFIQDIALGINFTLGSEIIAISDSIIFVDNNGTIEIWEYTDMTNTLLLYHKCKREIMSFGIAEINGNIDWIGDQVLELWDDDYDLLFRGKNVEESGWGQDRRYLFYGLEKEDLTAKITLNYQGVATGVHVIAKAIIDQIDNYLYYDDTSIPDPGISYAPKWEGIYAHEGLTELQDKIDGIWYVEPDGKVWLLKATSLVSSGITEDSTTGNINSPIYNRENRTYNYIHLYGRGYIESDGDSKDDASIRLHGIQELIRYYPGCTSLTELQAIAASLLARDGIASSPVNIEFTRKSTGYQLVGETLNFAFTPMNISFLNVATDYIIKGIRNNEDDSVDLLLTNTTFQQGIEYE